MRADALARDETCLQKEDGMRFLCMQNLIFHNALLFRHSFCDRVAAHCSCCRSARQPSRCDEVRQRHFLIKFEIHEKGALLTKICFCVLSFILPYQIAENVGTDFTERLDSEDRTWMHLAAMCVTKRYMVLSRDSCHSWGWNVQSACLCCRVTRFACRFWPGRKAASWMLKQGAEVDPEDLHHDTPLLY